MNIEGLLEPLSESSPAGEDCGYAFEFQQISALADYLTARAEQEELERQAKANFDGENAESDQRNAESFAADGRRRLDGLTAGVKEIIGRAPSPDIARSEIIARSEAMLTRTGKDIRVAQHLALAWLGESGLPGLAAGWALVDGLLERFEATAHPMPDEDDPTDLTARAMVVSELISGAGFLSVLRETVVMSAPGAGRMTGRDAEVMDGALEDDRSNGVRSSEQIRAIGTALAAANAGVPPDQVGPEAVNGALSQVAALVGQCLDTANRIVARFPVGSLRGDRVQKLLQRIKSQLDQAASDGAPAANAAGVADAHGGGAAAGAAGRLAGPSLGGLQSREDARRVILEVSRFIERTEPSHPAPLFLKRAERLLGAKNFFAIVRDMTPDALSELERITGQREENE